MLYEDVRLEGHIIDSLTLPQVLDDILALGGDYRILDFQIGHTPDDTSTAVVRVHGRDAAHLEDLLERVGRHGAEALDTGDAVLVAAPGDGVFPEGFYSTTNLETFIRIDGGWLRVEFPEMDCAVRVDRDLTRAETVPLNLVRAGDLVAVGRQGLRVVPMNRPAKGKGFEFMSSVVSSEKPKALIIGEVAEFMRCTKGEGRPIIGVLGPAVVHTGAAPAVARLVRAGWIDVVFGGNAVATHDIEAALYGTSLGVSLHEGTPVHGGHEHHLRAINRIRACGGIAQAVEQGVLTSGLFYEIVRAGVPFVLAGSIRDDGPLPEVITDVLEAQQAMRVHARSAGMCLMLSTMLHSIATGNLLPAGVRTVCVDINPSVVTKLADRGTQQAVGVVTDVGLFLGELADDLGVA